MCGRGGEGEGHSTIARRRAARVPTQATRKTLPAEAVTRSGAVPDRLPVASVLPSRVRSAHVGEWIGASLPHTSIEMERDDDMVRAARLGPPFSVAYL